MAAYSLETIVRYVYRIEFTNASTAILLMAMMRSVITKHAIVKHFLFLLKQPLFFIDNMAAAMAEEGTASEKRLFVQQGRKRDGLQYPGIPTE